jgi:bacterioferritin-associated ferredoxin
MLKISRTIGRRRLQGLLTRSGGETQANLVCHCRRVPYATVEKAILRGAHSIADLQRKTTACTRCFGCRFELEGLLKAHLGDDYHHQSTIALPEGYEKAVLPNPMYMPVLAGFRGYEVDTRVIVFNWEGPRRPVGFRADLMLTNGERVAAWQHAVQRGFSTVIDLSRGAVGALLPDGVGVAKLVLDRAEVGSLRPYFHLSTPTSVTTTHEKKGPKDPRRQTSRRYHWVFPIGRSRRPEEVYFVFVHTQLEPMTAQRLVWQSVDGETTELPLPTLEFEQAAFVPLHEHVPAIANGSKAGSVRLAPAEHVVAGFMIRHDPEAQLWRVQHL